MNRYEVRISGSAYAIQVRASKASVAMARALNRLTDSNFLNTAITIRYIGRVPRVYYVKAMQITRNEHGSMRSLKTLARDLPTKAAAEAEIARLRSTNAGYEHFHITSSLAEGL